MGIINFLDAIKYRFVMKSSDLHLHRLPCLILHAVVVIIFNFVLIPLKKPNMPVSSVGINDFDRSCDVFFINNCCIPQLHQKVEKVVIFHTKP